MSEQNNIKKDQEPPKPGADKMEMEFDVMPDVQSEQESVGQTHVAPPDLESMKARNGDWSNKTTLPIPENDEAGDSGSRRKYLIIAVVSVVALLVLGGGYLIYTQYFGEEKDSPADLINIDELGGENENQSGDKDNDNDGLSAEKEAEFGTDANNPDSDGDGFADGDEINIYETNPLLQDTDGDGFLDSQEPVYGFSPIQNSKEKASSDEIKKWEDRIAELGLHEPTKSTIILKQKEKDGSAELEKKAMYANQSHGYQLEVSEILDHREAIDGSQVGFFVRGTDPGNEPIISDPIYIMIAIKDQNQTLDEWIDAQYKIGDYAEKSVVSGFDGSAVKIKGVSSGEGCPSDGTYFASKGSEIVVITLNCNTNEEYSKLYDQMVASLKFN